MLDKQLKSSIIKLQKTKEREENKMFNVFVAGSKVATKVNQRDAEMIVAFYRMCHPRDCVWMVAVEA